MQQEGLRRRLGYRATDVAASELGPEDDDWLSDVGEVEWVDTMAPAWPAGREPGREPLAHRADARWDMDEPELAPPGDWPTPDEVHRRRAVAAAVAVAVVVAAIAVPVLVFRGGGGGTQSPPPTSPPTTTTATTTPTTPKTTTPKTQALPTVTLPANGQLRRGVDDIKDVTQLQKALAQLGFEPGTVDGVFGLKTQAAVVSFQESKGLPNDGIVGQQTARALNQALAARAGTTG